jgi:hypothetical protein
MIYVKNALVLKSMIGKFFKIIISNMVYYTVAKINFFFNLFSKSCNT